MRHGILYDFLFNVSFLHNNVSNFAGTLACLPLPGEGLSIVVSQAAQYTSNACMYLLFCYVY